MFPASTKQNGQCLAVPDVCLTPAPPASPLPMPYPNIGLVITATNECKKVKICQMAALNVGAEIPSSQGNEPGVNGGTVSGKNMDKVIYKQSSERVKFEGAGAVFFSAETAHNGANANMPSGKQITPSQTKILVGM